MRFLCVLFILAGCQTKNFSIKSNLKKKSSLNGVEFLSFKDDSVPYFKVVLWSPDSVSRELESQKGVTSLMASLLIEGSENFSKEVLVKAFSDIGSEFYFHMGSDYVAFGASSLTQDSEKLAEVFSEVVLNPKFANKSIYNLKLKKLAQLKQVQDNPSALAKLAYHQQMFGAHAYSRHWLGDTKTLTKLRRDEVRARYEQVFYPKNLKLALIGNWTDEAEVALFSKISDLAFDSYLESPEPPKVAEKAEQRVFVNKSDLKQAVVNMGWTAISYSNTDFEALSLAAFILGGSFKSKLNQELRINKGLTYGVGAFVEAYKNGGLFTVSGKVRHDKLAEFVMEAEKVLSFYARNGFSLEDLAKAKAVIKGQYPRGIETREAEAAAFLSNLAKGVKGENVYSYLDRVLGLSLDEVNDALRKYLVKDRMNLNVLGHLNKVSSKDKKLLRLGSAMSYRKLAL